MRFFAATALLPLAAQAAVVARQACNDTATLTVTPAAITQIKEIYVTAAYSTSVVTRLALQSSATSAAAASSTAAAVANKLMVRQCPSPTTTITQTAQAPTSTVSTTVTFSKAARATSTAAACQASNNYGLVNGVLSLNQKGALPSVQTFPDLSIEDCCNACFTNPSGCMAWSFGGSVSNGVAQDGCTMSLMTSGCPASAGTEVIVYQNADKPLVGVGACDVQVLGFSH